MIVQGSINYTPSGRKRKTVRSKSKKYEFRELKTKTRTPERKMYPSRIPSVHATDKKCFPKGNRVTVAIPYSKGPYQVIPESDIKYIGK